ncbi:hypothetical protein LCGC14_3100610, partial [marine sediment metagenome]
IEVQVSPNDSDWATLKTTLEITAGDVNISGTVNARFVRLKVKTAEGGDSVEDLYLNVK